MRHRILPVAKHFCRQVPDQHTEIYVIRLCISSLFFCMFWSLVGLLPKKYATSRNPSCSVLSFQEEKFGRHRQQSKSTVSQEFYFSQILKFSLGAFSDHCDNIYLPSHTYTAWNTTDKMYNTILPEYFHHGSPPKNSPTAHLHCQFFLHIRPLSRSWQLWHLVHPGNLGSHTEWQWCFHTWFVRVQVDYWGDFNLLLHLCTHNSAENPALNYNVLYFYAKSSIFTQLQKIFLGFFFFQAEY